MMKSKTARSTLSTLRTNLTSGTTIRSKTAVSSTTVNNVVTFSCSPDIVVFDSYEEGGTYYKTFKATNMTNRSAVLRMSKVRTRYFQISAVVESDQPVAPGMSREFRVKFCPDSLSDFDDSVDIRSEANSFTLLLQGRRPHPELSMPRILDCGHCLVNSLQAKIIDCRNNGGDGYFKFVREPILMEVASDISESNIFEIGSFSIQPQSFQLMAGETISFEVVFRPENIGEERQKIYLAVDNQQCYEYIVSGSASHPNVVAAHIDEIPFDSRSTPALLQFDDLTPMSSATKSESVSIRNNTPCHLLYHWEIFYDIYDQPSEISDNDNPYAISPATGWFSEVSDTPFEITFAPASPGDYSAFLILMVDNVPNPSDETHPYFQHCQLNVAQMKELLVQRRSQNDPSQFFTPFDHIKDIMMGPSSEQTEAKTSISIPCVIIRVDASCSKFDVRSNPPAVVFGSPIERGETFTKSFNLVNHSMLEASFEWPSQSSEHIIVSFSPAKGVLKPRSSQSIELQFSPSYEGEMEFYLKCNIINSHELIVPIRAKTKGPTLIIDTPAIDFGIVETCRPFYQQLEISNESQIPVEWKISTPDSLSKYLSFEPSLGVIQPMSNTSIVVTFSSEEPFEIDVIVPIEVTGGENKYISLKGRTQHINLIISEPIIDLGETYEDCPITRTFTIKNLCYYATSFYWYTEHLEKEYTNEVDITIQPEEGTLVYGQEETITVVFHPRKLGNYDIVIPCLAQDQDEPKYGIILRTVTKGLLIALDIEGSPSALRREITAVCDNIVASCLRRALGEEDEEEEDGNDMYLPAIDFGEVQVHTRKTVCLKIQNLSDCVGFFAASFDNYFAPVEHSRRKRHTSVSFHPINKSLIGNDTERSLHTTKSALKRIPQSIKSIRKSSKRSSRAMQREEVAFSNPENQEVWTKMKEAKLEKEFDKEMLAGGKGIAFDVESLNGRISGFDTISLNLTCYSDMCGDYTDSFRLEIVGLPPVLLPVTAKVVGDPRVLKKALTEAYLTRRLESRQKKLPKLV